MDIDISDILASVTRAHNGTTSQTNGSLLRDDGQQQADLQALTRAWVAERVAPELLLYPATLIQRMMRRIRQQIETIEESTARRDAGTSFGLVIIQTELERIKFLLRSFLRARLVKIDAHSLHILNLYQSTDQDDDMPLLSPQELQYLTTHAALLERHYNASFLSSFPPKLRRLDDRAGAGGSGMVEGPDLDKAVFVRCLGVPTGTSARLRNGRNNLYDDEDDGDMHDDDMEDEHRPVSVSCGYVAASNEERRTDSSFNPTQSQAERHDRERVIDMRRGDIWMVRWSAVRDAVQRGDCELV